MCVCLGEKEMLAGNNTSLLHGDGVCQLVFKGVKYSIVT